MWDWARNSEGGKATETLAMLASPGRGVITAVRAGNLLRLVPPLSESLREGLKPRRPHSASWKRLLRAALAPLALSSEPVTAVGSQVVGLRVKPGLSIRIETERTSRGMPWRMVGIGSDLA